MKITLTFYCTKKVTQQYYSKFYSVFSPQQPQQHSKHSTQFSTTQNKHYINRKLLRI